MCRYVRLILAQLKRSKIFRSSVFASVAHPCVSQLNDVYAFIDENQTIHLHDKTISELYHHFVFIIFLCQKEYFNLKN